MKTFELAEAIARQLRNEATDADRLLIDNWVNTHTDNQSYFQKILEDKDKVMELMLRTDSNLALTRLKQRIEQTDHRDAEVRFSEDQWPAAKIVQARKPWRKLGWAAAVLAMMVVAAYLYLNSDTIPQNQKDKKALAVQDILPASEKATLTLADGRTILLDTVSEGAIANQGGARIVKHRNGEIHYDLKGSNQGEVMLNTMSTPRGGQFKIMLPDGTQVWLNAASSITYPAVFSGNNRKVKISGEVYMEVAPSKARPFLVDIDGKQTLQVLGTSFNISSYKDDDEIKTTLVSGSVRVESGRSTAVLKPGFQAIQPVAEQADRDKFIIQPADIDQVIAWKTGMFKFSNVSIEAIMRQLARWYNVEVVYERKINQSFTATIPRNLPLSEVLENLSLTSAVQFTIHNKTVTIK